MFRVEFRTGKGGRIRWFVARKDTGQDNVQLLSAVVSSTEQESWEHAEWAIGAGVTFGIRAPRSGICNVR